MIINSTPEQERTALNFSTLAKERFDFLHDLGFVEIESSPTIVRYRKDSIEVDVYHGRQSYEISFGISHDGVRFSISEIIRAIDPETAKKYRNPAATTQDVLAKSLLKLEKLVKQYCKQALQGNQDVFEALNIQRKTWAKKYALEVLAGQLRPRADEAFRLGRYHEAAELYKRIRPLLSPAEIKKLTIAEKRSTS